MLRLAERIAEQHRRAPFGSVMPPPRVDALEYGSRRFPTIDWESERRLGDEGIAAYRLERSAGRIGIEFVVAGGDPHAAAMFDSYLRRTEYMARRMQRDRYAVDVK